ncbi:MAG TPA: hypothetical protein VGX28_16065 [Frankiaceae bacterium]|jgi:hypothetical protein|nr:hypothetical protein [Frankiaceae bacterium]
MTPRRRRLAGTLLLVAATLVAVAAVAGAVYIGGWLLVALVVWSPVHAPTLCALPFVVRLGWRLRHDRPLGEAGLAPLLPFAWLPVIGVVAGEGWSRFTALVVVALVAAAAALASPTSEPPS